MPPSDSPRDGHTELTDIARSYVYAAPPPPPPPYCCAFIDSCTRVADALARRDAHSSCDASTSRPSAALDALAMRQRSVYAAFSPLPSTATRVPPLACRSAW